MLHLTLLGGFRASFGSGERPVGFPTRKAQALLAYLASPPGRAHPRDQLASLLWGNSREDQAHTSLRQAIYAIRRALAPGGGPTLWLAEATVTLDPAAVEVDTVVFERHVAEGTPRALEAATALYQGELLEGLAVNEPAFEEWLLAERERLRELVLEALARLLEHHRKAGTVDDAILAALRVLALDPLQEAVHRALMRLYVRIGRRGPALQQYQRCVSVLQRELGLEPEAETQALYREILQARAARPTLAAVEGVSGWRPEPLIGLRAGGLLPETPLVGRDTELAGLEEALRMAWSGRGAVVALLGEAGLGKTRLAAELIQRALAGGGSVLLGHSRETERILPFGPWVEAMRTAGLTSDADVLDRLDAARRADLGRLIPEWAPAGAPATSASLESWQLFEGLAGLVAGLAEVRPLLLVLEDLHWADEMSLRLMGFLGRRLTGVPALLLVTARDEELPEAALLRETIAELGRDGHLVRVRLAPLSEEATHGLVRRLGRTGADEAQVAWLAAKVWASSEGHPLVIVESVRAYHGAPDTADRSAVPLSDRVHQVVTHHLERVGEPARALAAVLAVGEGVMDFALLRRAAQLGEDEAARGVEELVRRRLVRGADEGFELTHAWIRRVVYDELLVPRRRLLHRRVAEALECAAPVDRDAHLVALSQHYREGEVWAKAAACFREAGARALGRCAPREAAAAFEQALAALERLPQDRGVIEQAIDVRLDLRLPLGAVGEVERIGEHLAVAEALAHGLGDRPRLARVLAHRTFCHYWSGDPEVSREAGQRALAAADSLENPDSGLTVMIQYHLGLAHMALGAYRDAIALYEQTLGQVDHDPSGDRLLPFVGSVACRTWIGVSHALLGEFEAGHTASADGLQRAQAVGHAFTLAFALQGVGGILTLQGRFDEAIDPLAQSRNLCRQFHGSNLLASVSGWLGWCLALSGRAVDSLPYLKEAVELSVSQRHRSVESGTLVALGEAYLLQDRWDAAAEAAQRAVQLARRYKRAWFEIEAQRVLGEVHAAADDIEAAEASLHDALGKAEALSLRPVAARCRLALGMLLARAGRPAEAGAALRAAREQLRAMAMIVWVERADAALDEVGGRAAR
jgi:DNA-binding SARP family transcriptional activator